MTNFVPSKRRIHAEVYLWREGVFGERRQIICSNAHQRCCCVFDRPSISLASACGASAVSARRTAEALLEFPGKETVIDKAGREGDLAVRLIPVKQLPAPQQMLGPREPQ